MPQSVSLTISRCALRSESAPPDADAAAGALDGDGGFGAAGHLQRARPPAPRVVAVCGHGLGHGVRTESVPADSWRA